MFNKYKKMLKDIDAKLNHIQDIAADNRVLIVKLIKQSNQVVSFLKELDADIHDSYQEHYGEDFRLSNHFNEVQSESKKVKNVQELIDNFIEKNKDLKEFEEELKKHKDKITPGTLGES
tara:strand:+ start:572 stop:928 length:357 start_codon:yes stop_codon:yes gene_type:complete